MSRPFNSDDALLSGLSRLRASEPSRDIAPDVSGVSALGDGRLRPQRSRSTSANSSQTNISYDYFPFSSSGRRIDPITHVSRVDTVEVIEHATGLGKSDDGDFAAAEKLLRWIRSGSVEAADVFKSIVAGSAGTNPALNARVLAVVTWLIIAGGPDVLPPAVYVTNTKRPSPALRICLDVLSSLGYDEDPEALLHDDNKVRNMKISVTYGAGEYTDELTRGRRNISTRNTMLIAAVEAYAISLGRKLIFHNRYPEIEANYSLDRYYRKMHIESRADPRRDALNRTRHGAIMSRDCLERIRLITRAAVVAADRLERARVSPDITALAAAEACNAYSFAGYLHYKLAKSENSDIGLAEEQSCLADLIYRIQKRGGGEARILKRFSDAAVVRAATDERVRPKRPESKHRREVLCTFTSFRSLHRALEPPLRRHRDIAQ